jgi:uncharacterized membrane protein YkvA (DUF1232 family)
VLFRTTFDLMRTLIIALGALLSIYAVAIVALLIAGRKTAAAEIVRLLPNFAVLFKGLMGDSRVPRSSKALLLFGAAWIASPIDLIPELVPFLGPLDDAVVVALIVRRLARSAGSEVVQEHWRGHPDTIALLLGTKRFSTDHRGVPPSWGS